MPASRPSDDHPSLALVREFFHALSHTPFHPSEMKRTKNTEWSLYDGRSTMRISSVVRPLSLYLCVVLAVLCLSAPAFGQDAAGAGDPVREEALVPDDAIEGMMPEPDYSGGWTMCPFLSGDRGGSRQGRANSGVIFDVNWLRIDQGVVSGAFLTRAHDLWGGHGAGFRVCSANLRLSQSGSRFPAKLPPGFPILDVVGPSGGRSGPDFHGGL